MELALYLNSPCFLWINRSFQGDQPFIGFQNHKMDQPSIFSVFIKYEEKNCFLDMYCQ